MQQGCVPGSTEGAFFAGVDTGEFSASKPCSDHLKRAQRERLDTVASGAIISLYGNG
jgi:hypothetical protein